MCTYEHTQHRTLGWKQKERERERGKKIAYSDDFFKKDERERVGSLAHTEHVNEEVLNFSGIYVRGVDIPKFLL